VVETEGSDVERCGIAEGQAFDNWKLRSRIGTAIAEAHASTESKVEAKLIISVEVTGL
jgi:hypothetical protein